MHRPSQIPSHLRRLQRSSSEYELNLAPAPVTVRGFFCGGKIEPEASNLAEEACNRGPGCLIIPYASCGGRDTADFRQRHDGGDSSAAALDQAWPLDSSADSRPAAAAASSGLHKFFCDLRWSAAAGGSDHASCRAVRLRGD